ncbi:uncharacterized protein LOC131039866 [Cryptomeria japonica]|uniref:uncharacterized protein LOC131039866 n=1 Tax=Cryptomeria japonica TaxID=3369 RepID=UPI0027DA40E2|nr:uncharacterized protein LOC131039866 [Cryptomeria japonica]
MHVSCFYQNCEARNPTLEDKQLELEWYYHYFYYCSSCLLICLCFIFLGYLKMGDGSKVCFNAKCGAAMSARWRSGWLLRSGKIAELCERCGIQNNGLSLGQQTPTQPETRRLHTEESPV